MVQVSTGIISWVMAVSLNNDGEGTGQFTPKVLEFPLIMAGEIALFEIRCPGTGQLKGKY
ncbi:MAG: hypothetical protein OXE78_12555 [Gammaproteobacteria bacterium]|nr:hypothetical protein [Gammaproteobacteria bacterium]MCY4356063.1 hypothetical protein [Gammaproteobacteria bacterium]